MATAARADLELHQDMLFEILKWLPLKSLCRFRSVSKLWHSIIFDPCFVEAHYAHYCTSHPKLLIFHTRFRENDGYEEVKLHSADYPRHPNDSTLSLTYHGVPDGLTDVNISPSVNSLYCLDYGNLIKILNPATGKNLEVEIEDDMIVNYTSRSYEIINHFGFDPVEKKHKILSVRKDRATAEMAENRVLVPEEGRWRRKLNNYPSNIRLPDRFNDVCINGVIFIYSSDEEDENFKPCLLAFHVRSEEFREIPIPEEASRDTVIVEFMGRAALVEHSGTLRDDGKKFDMWILEDLENNVWGRRRTFVIPGSVDRYQELVVDCAVPTGELLLIPVFTETPFLSFFIVMYDVESKNMRQIEFRGLQEHLKPKEIYVTRVHFYVESLRSIIIGNYN